MKNYLIRIGTFLIIFFVCYYSFLFVLFEWHYLRSPLIQCIQKKIPVTKGVFSRSLAEYSTLDSVDYLFVGSSHCYRGIDPAIFIEQGMTSFNLGSSSQTPLNTYSILEKSISRTKNVVLELYPVACAIPADESFVDLFRCSPDYVFLLKQAIRMHAFLPFQFLMMKPLVDRVIQNKKYDPCIFHSGYVQVTDSAKNKKIVYEKQPMDAGQLQIQFGYIEKIARLCLLHHKKLYLVFAPVPNQLSFSREVDYRKHLYKIIKEYKLTFFDFSRMNGLHDGYHFYDDDHLNAAGVKIFNEALIRKLKESGS